MKCGQCRKRLMTAERPDWPARQVVAHLTKCQACRSFQRQLVTVEANVARVPVPAPVGKRHLLEQILGTGPEQRQVADCRLLSVDRGLKLAAAPASQSAMDMRRLLRKRWLLAGKWASGVAAAAVLVSAGIWLGNSLSRTETTDPGGTSVTAVGPGVPVNESPKKKVSDPFAKKGPQKVPAPVAGKTLIAQLMECDVKMAEAGPVRERVAALAEMAEVIQQESRQLATAAPAGVLTQLAALHKQVIDEGVMPLAQNLPVEERPDVAKGLKLQSPVEVVATDGVAKERIRQLERDQVLIQALVAGGIKLAAEDDPLRRADLCHRIADTLAAAIKQAVQIQDAPRAAQLGEQMEILLVQGIAANLDLARESMEPDSPREPEIIRVGSAVAGVAQMIQDEIGRLPVLDANMQRTMQAVAKGKAKVESAGLPRGKGGKSKKGKQIP